MKFLRRFIQIFAGILALAFVGYAGTTTPTPVVNSTTIDYSVNPNRLTIMGSGFSTPTVTFGGTNLAIVSTSPTQIVATLPATVAAGSYNLVVVVGLPGQKVPAGSTTVSFNLTYGAVGPQGVTGPMGLQGQAGVVQSISPGTGLSGGGSAADVPLSLDLSYTDQRYPTRELLSNAGTLNSASNPVDWTQLKNVPPGVANGSGAQTPLLWTTYVAVAGGGVRAFSRFIPDQPIILTRILIDAIASAYDTSNSNNACTPEDVPKYEIFDGSTILASAPIPTAFGNDQGATDTTINVQVPANTPLHTTITTGGGGCIGLAQFVNVTVQYKIP